MLRTKTQSQPEDERSDVHSETENTGTRMESEVEQDTDKEILENLSKETPNDFKKENERDLSKRSTVLKRTSNSTTAPGAKATSSVNRNAGTSKPPTRPISAVSSTRKSTSSSGLGHTRSAHSSGGSGDEQRKALASAARRASLTQVSHHQPVKIETLAEKRGITGGNSRKPTASANSTSTKPVVKPASTTNKNGSSLKGTTIVTAKQSTSGSTSETKKRLSIISGSTSTTKPTIRSSTVSSKEIDELKIKIAGNEILIEDQKNEIKASKERTEKLSEQLAEETKRLTLLETELRKENTGNVEKLQFEHSIELQQLQAELEKAKHLTAIDQERLTKSIEEAQKKEARENATVIQKMKKDFESSISALNSELNIVKEKCATVTLKLSEKENEIISLEAQLKKARDHQEELEQEYQNNTKVLRQSLIDQHETSLCALKLEYEEKISETKVGIESTQEQKLAALAKDYESKISELQDSLGKSGIMVAEEANKKQLLETRIDELSKVTSIKQAEIDSMKNKAEQDSILLTRSSDSVKELNEKYNSSQEKIEQYKKEISIMTEKLKNSEAECSTKSQDLRIVQDELDQTKAQLFAQSQMKLILDADEKSKDESFKKLNADLEATKKKLAERKHEIDRLCEKHCQEISEITSGYQTKIKFLEEDSINRGELENVQAKYDESVRNHEKSLTNHRKELKNFEQDNHKKMKLLENKNQELEKKIKNLELASQTAGKIADEKFFLDQISSHTAEFQGLQASHKEAISALQKAHMKDILEISSSKEELQSANDALKTQLFELKANLDQTQDDLKLVHQTLERERISNNLALAELDIAKTKSEDSEEKQVSMNSQEEMQEDGIENKAENTQEYVKTTENSIKHVKVVDNKIIDTGHELRESDAQLRPKDNEKIEVNTVSIFDSMISSRNTNEKLINPDEMKGEPDDPSAALALIAQARVIAEQLSQMNDDLRNENFRSFSSRTEASSKIAQAKEMSSARIK